MRGSSLTLFCGLLVFLAQGACVNSTGMHAGRWESVRSGMTRDEVLAVLGPPQRKETYGSTEFLIYSTDGSSNTALLDFMPIAIVEGRVTGIGRGLYETVVRATRESGESLAKDRVDMPAANHLEHPRV